MLQLVNCKCRHLFIEYSYLTCSFCSASMLPDVRRPIASEVLDEDPAYRLALVAWHTTPEFSDWKQLCGLNWALLLALPGLPRVSVVSCWSAEAEGQGCPQYGTLRVIFVIVLAPQAAPGSLTRFRVLFCHFSWPPQPSCKGWREGPHLFTGEDVKLYCQGEKTQAGDNMQRICSTPRSRIKIKTEDVLAEKFWSFSCSPFISKAF